MPHLHHCSFILLFLLHAAGAGAQPVIVDRVTNPLNGAQPNGAVSDPALSGDARYLFFVTTASNLGPAANGATNLYRYDLSDLAQPADRLQRAMPLLGNGNSIAPSVSLFGDRYAFQTLATNLGGLQSTFSDVYYGVEEPGPLPGESTFTLFLVGRGLNNTAPNGEARSPSISGDGRYVAFYSDSTNLVPGDSNAAPDIFLADSVDLTAAPERISVDSSGTPFAGPSFPLSNRSVSQDGRHVVFAARAPAGLTTNISDVFLRDRAAGTTSLVSRLPGGAPFNSASDQAAISYNARYVAFRSFATNGPNPSGSRIWILDRTADALTSVPLPPQAASCEEPRVSNDADLVMQCSATGAGTSAQAWWYSKDSGLIRRMSSAPGDVAGNGVSGNFMDMDVGGDVLVFDSEASNLVPGDTNNSSDVFLALDLGTFDPLFADGFE